jgi:hypothetical protein
MEVETRPRFSAQFIFFGICGVISPKPSTGIPDPSAMRSMKLKRDVNRNPTLKSPRIDRARFFNKNLMPN